MKFISVFFLSIILFQQPATAQMSKPFKNIKLKFFVGAGLSLSRPYGGGFTTAGMGSLKFNPIISSTFSNGIDVYFRKLKKAIARFQVSFSEFDYKGKGIPHTIVFDELGYELAGYNITYNFSGLYQIAKGKRVRWYAGAGLNLHSPRYTRSWLYQKTDGLSESGYVSLNYKDPALAPEIKGMLLYKKFELNLNAAYGRIVKEELFSLNVASATLNLFYHFY